MHDRNDSFFGRLIYDKGLNRYRASMPLEEKTVYCSLLLDEVDDIDAYLLQSRRIAKWIFSHVEAIKTFAAEQLLELKNQTWREENDAETTMKDFYEQMSLESATIYADQSAEVYFDDGDLFWGHSILVYIAPGNFLQSADIAG